jgi:leucyl-tRNA synthetase
MFYRVNVVSVKDKKKNRAVVKSTGEQVVMSWEKMSKSKRNGVDPGDMFQEYGSDTTRLLILADVAPTSHRNWNSNSEYLVIF